MSPTSLTGTTNLHKELSERDSSYDVRRTNGASASPFILHPHPTRIRELVLDKPVALQNLSTPFGGRLAVWVCHVTRFFVIGSADSFRQYAKKTHNHLLPPSRYISRLRRNVDDPQVILRPSLSTRGRSNQQRLFLRHPASSSTFVWTVQPTDEQRLRGQAKDRTAI